MTTFAACIECGEARRPSACSRGAQCGKCRAAGRRLVPRARYASWLLQRRARSVPTDTARVWLTDLVGEHEDLATVSHLTGLPPRRLWGVFNEDRVRITTAEKIAMAAGRLVDMALAYPPDGRDGWSDAGRYCGDGTGFEGCGSWFHEHLQSGLCAECYLREVAGWPIEPRDVRVTRQAREKEMARA